MVRNMGEGHYPSDMTGLDEETLAVLNSNLRSDVKYRLVDKLQHGRRVTADERRQRMRGGADDREANGEDDEAIEAES